MSREVSPEEFARIMHESEDNFHHTTINGKPASSYGRELAPALGIGSQGIWGVEKTYSSRKKLDNGLWECIKTDEFGRMVERHYEDDKKRFQGIQEEWDRSDWGNNLKISYKDSNFDGDYYRYWDIEHKKIREHYFYKNGKEESSEEYYKNGALKAKASFKDGNGYREEYDEKGTLRKKSFYMNGKLDGYTEEYDENGVLRKKSLYKNGKLDGYTEEYDENGVLRKKSFYKKGELDGTCVEYDEHKHPIKRSVYKNGKFIEDNTKLGRRGLAKLLTIANKLPPTKARKAIKEKAVHVYRKFAPKTKRSESR